MREIKFRVWSKGKMTNVNYPETITISDGRITFWEQANHVGNTDAIFMQFTGLKDKNGKEIYEGDILKHYVGLPPTMELIHVVSYYVDGFKVSNIKNTTKKNYLNQEIINVPKSSNYRTWSISEVIGNIYENPELVKP